MSACSLVVSLHDSAFRDYGLRDVIRMLILGPLDLLLYRPILMYAGLRGCWSPLPPCRFEEIRNRGR